MKNIWKIIFGIVCILQLSALAIDAPTLVWVTKPLLMPALAAWLFSETKGGRFLRIAWLSGLVFSTAGDILLMWTAESNGEIFFILGLGAFLLAHIFYIGGLWAELKGKPGFLRQHPVWILPLIAYLFVLLYRIWPGIPPGLHGPVAAYGIVITSMALSVIQLRTHVTRPVFTLLLVGAILFVLSDSLLAMEKFGNIQLGHLSVMLTYIAGQALLAVGVMRMLRNM